MRGTGNRIKVSLVQIEAFDSSFLHSIASLRPQPTSSLPESCEACRDTANMPVDLNGYWKMISSDNFEEYLKALGEFLKKHCRSRWKFWPVGGIRTSLTSPLN